MINAWMADLKYAFRMLVKNPGFTIITVLVLALGIGCTTAIFSVVHSVLLQPLSYNNSDRILMLSENTPKMETSVAYPNFQDVQNQASLFDSMAVFRLDSFNLTSSGEAERLQGRMISSDFFKVLQASPALGRVFRSDEDRPGATPVVILAYDFWQRKFNSDPKILGKQITLNDAAYTVVGITPAHFDFLTKADLFVPVGQFVTDRWRRGNHPGLYIIARMKPNVTIDQIRFELNTIAGRLAKQYPDTNKDRTILVRGLHESIVEDIRPALLLLSGAVVFVLLIVCANVANMHLVKIASRQREIAIRSALGARRMRLVRQILTETILIGLVGGALGVLLAVWGIDLLRALHPDSVPRLNEIVLDSKVLVFALGVSLFTGLCIGILPAIQFSGAMGDSLRETTNRVSRGIVRKSVRQMLIVGELALALMLLVGAGLMIRSFVGIERTSPGFDSSNLLTMRISISVKPEEGPRAVDFLRNLRRGIEGLSGVDSVTISNGLPIAGAGEGLFYDARLPLTDDHERMGVQYIVDSNYFKTLRIPLLKGRVFSSIDTKTSPFSVVIDEALANTCFPNEDPLGKQLSPGPELPNMQIIGVVGHVKHYGVDVAGPVQSQFYYDIDQVPDQYLYQVASYITVTVRTSGEPSMLIPAIRSIAQHTDKSPADLRDTDDGAAAVRIRWRKTICDVAIFTVCLGCVDSGSRWYLRRDRVCGANPIA